MCVGISSTNGGVAAHYSSLVSFLGKREFFFSPVLCSTLLLGNHPQQRYLHPLDDILLFPTSDMSRYKQSSRNLKSGTFKLWAGVMCALGSHDHIHISHSTLAIPRCNFYHNLDN